MYTLRSTGLSIIIAIAIIRTVFVLVQVAFGVTWGLAQIGWAFAIFTVRLAILPVTVLYIFFSAKPAPRRVTRRTVRS